MSKKKYTIRLYRSHDHDLITFMECHQFNIIKAIYSSLTAFSHGDLFIIKIPPKRENGAIDLNRVYTRQLALDTKQDAEAIAVLEKLKNGSKNNFLKNLLRLYLCYPLAESALLDEEDMEWFYEKFAIFRLGKREAAAGKLKKVSKQEQQTEPDGQERKPTVEKAMPEKKVPKKAVPQHKPAAVVEEPDYETAISDIEDFQSNIEKNDNDNDVTDMFSAILS